MPTGPTATGESNCGLRELVTAPIIAFRASVSTSNVWPIPSPMARVSGTETVSTLGDSVPSVTPTAPSCRYVAAPSR